MFICLDCGEIWNSPFERGFKHKNVLFVSLEIIPDEQERAKIMVYCKTLKGKERVAYLLQQGIEYTEIGIPVVPFLSSKELKELYKHYIGEEYV